MPRYKPLTEEQKQKIMDLRSLGLNGYEIARALGIGKTTVYKYLPKHGRFLRRWTEDEKQKMIDWLARGWSREKVAAKLGRSPTAVRIAMCRYRKRIRADPQKREVLRYLKIGLETGAKPGKVITAIRRAKILGRGIDVL